MGKYNPTLRFPEIVNDKKLQNNIHEFCFIPM